MISLWNLPVLRLVTTDRCRVAAPWFAWSHGGDPTAALRRRAADIEQRALGATHVIERQLAALVYLPLSIPRLLLALIRSGPALRSADRVSWWRQASHLITCAWRLGLRPQVYYQLRLHARPRTSAWAAVIDPAELHHLQRAISPPDLAPLCDKLRFAERAFAHGLSAVPILAVWQQGQRFPGIPPHAGDLQRDLFVKRAQSYGSIGVMAFRYNPRTGVHYAADKRLPAAGLAATLAEASRHATLLVQPRLANHRDLAGFSSGALCNYRIVTGRHPDGRTEIIVAALRFPLRSELTCAEADTTLCASVDPATGRLRAAESRNPALGRMTHHPVSGQPIEAHPVPRWAELQALALRAHDAWPDFPFIGWDLCDTGEGILLLEGGCLWGGFLAQMSGSLPLGQTAFTPIYHAHLKHRAGLRT